jgi:hypothetical protein
MADEPDSEPVGGRASLRPIMWAFALMLLMVVFPQVVLLVLVGSLPTIVAFWTDRMPQKYAALCVGGMNLSGVFPFFMDLWTGRNNLSQAWDIMTDPLSLLTMYGAAAFGWALFIFLPPVVVAFLSVVAQHRIAQLRQTQRVLIREWGTGIASVEEEKENPPPVG